MFEINLTYDTFQCISTIAFVKNEAEVLDSPIWIMLINIVALEMLGAKMPKPTGISLDYYSPLTGNSWSMIVLWCGVVWCGNGLVMVW